MRSLLLVIGALLAMGISGFVGFLVGATGGSLAGTLGGVNLGICESLSVARRRQYITQTETQDLLNAVLEDSNFYRNNANRKVARETLTDCILEKLATPEPATPTPRPQPTTPMDSEPTRTDPEQTEEPTQ